MMVNFPPKYIENTFRLSKLLNFKLEFLMNGSGQYVYGEMLVRLGG